MRLRQRIMLAVVVSMIAASVAHAAELRVRVKGPGKEKVKIEKAEVLLVGWDWADRVPLPIEGDLVRVDFDSPAMRSQVLEKHPDLLTAFIYLKAENLTPIVSDPFTWLGSAPHRSLLELGVPEIRVDFRQREFVNLKAGEISELAVELKRPAERRVRFLDDAGKPVRNVRVAAYMFWANENRCGRMSGADLIATGSSDDEGRFAIPHGDFEYAFKLLDTRVRFSVPDTSDTDGYATLFLTQRETSLYIHLYASRPLTLRLFAGDEPLANALVSLGRNYCGPCGSCSSSLGATNASGVLSVDRYYPEEHDILCLVDDKGMILWLTSSYRLKEASTDVHLPAGTPAPTRVGVCPPYR